MKVLLLQYTGGLYIFTITPSLPISYNRELFHDPDFSLTRSCVKISAAGISANPNRMKKNPIPSLLVWLLMAVNVSAQTRAFTPRYSNTSVRGNIVYVSNSIISTTGIGFANPGTDEAPPGGTTKNGSTGLDIDIDNTATNLMNFGSTWSYYSNGAVPPVNPGAWTTVGYTTGAGWASGPGMFGYNASQATCIASGCAPACTPLASCNKYWTYYFRKTVSFNPTTYSAIRLNIKRNDGVVVYINGTERARDYMPTGTITNTTAAASDIPAVSPNMSIDLSTAFFNNGVNTIAVEVHVNKQKATEMYFDMEIQGITANGTFNSSSADLAIPTSCNQVLFAGLYWGAGQGNNGTSTSWITGETSCLLKIPGAGAYATVTSTQTDYHNSTLLTGLNHTGYKCFANITSLVNTANANGTYTVANIVSPSTTSLTDVYGGWTIVIVYSNTALPIRNLTVFDGNALIKSGNAPVDVGITGFLTPPAGAVSCELGAVVYDGDRASNDSFLFKQNGAATFYNLTPNATANLNDMWNSTIAYKGAVVTTRNPSFQNTLGYDANIINVPNTSNAQLGNSQTSATVRFASPSENYFVHVLTTSVSQYNPSFALQKTSADVNGGTLVGGDVLRYTINYNNLGNDVSLNSVITDQLPVNVGILPGSLKINGVGKTDAGADDQAEFDVVNRKVIFRIGAGATGAAGGTVPVGGTGTVSFDVIVASSCSVIACNPTISNTARVDYTGQTTLQNLYDSSAYDAGGGCFSPGPVVNTIAPSCYTPADTTLANICPTLSIILPWAKYAGYTFYRAKPFIAANVFDPTTPISTSGIYWAYINSGAGCIDTIRISVLRQNCPDLDEDDDGIPDYVELNNPLALQDADLDLIPNWLDTSYPGWVDNNADGLNDNFDPGADSDNDGIVNFMDANWPGYIDTNGDGVNDNFDTDLDGIPDFMDRDSDNDGIPDVVESGGVDANGDGKIDNFSDSDGDGLSQNVDAFFGVLWSGNGLGTRDTDGDGTPDYLDLDSDNDGIPDVREVEGIDANNDGMADNYTDNDADGYNDSIDGDANNDGIAENSANALLRTGADITFDGRADSYPYKNMEGDGKPNPYDLDSDGDGIVDVREAGFADANNDGRADGAAGVQGWNAAINAMPVLILVNTDGTGKPNFLDIDSDDDGIPDNVEGLPTSSYTLPLYGDLDGDGIDNVYDNIPGFGGKGITPNDQDADGIPDYIDLDTDNDGIADIVEGNDFNSDCMSNDNVALTFTDTDGDGLDDRFDASNSTVKGTSAFMGLGGILSGDVSPGSLTHVQRCSSLFERDWRFIPFLLDITFVSNTATLLNKSAHLQWVVTCDKTVDHFEVERSADGLHFSTLKSVAGTGGVCKEKSFAAMDNEFAGFANTAYYRIKAIAADGMFKYSSIIVVQLKQEDMVTVLPNPASNFIRVRLTTPVVSLAVVKILDATGKKVLTQTQQLATGTSEILITGIANLAKGVYTAQVMFNNEVYNQRLVVQR